MPRGGLRIGAGRPKGVTKVVMEARAAAVAAASAEVLRAEKAAGRARKPSMAKVDAEVAPRKKHAASKFDAGTPPTSARVKPETPVVDAVVLEAAVPTSPQTAADEQLVVPPPPVLRSPMEHMFWRMNDPSVPIERRDTLAIALAPYMHSKTGEVGKKELAQQAAENVSSGKFATAAPPKLSVVRP